MVGRPAVEKLASLQQASGSLHEEVWAGRNENLKSFQKCAVTVSYLSSLFIAPVPRGPGSDGREGGFGVP